MNCQELVDAYSGAIVRSCTGPDSPVQNLPATGNFDLGWVIMVAVLALVIGTLATYLTRRGR